MQGVGAFMYRGIVRDVDDPDKLGRIRCVVPELLHGEDQDEVLLDWALPVFPFGSVQDQNSTNLRGDHGFGFFAVPELDSIVWMTFEGGDMNRPLWVGVCAHVPNGPDGNPLDNTTPTEAMNSKDPDTGDLDYPKEKVWKSERVTTSATRRVRVELDSDQNPYISVGLDGNDAESGEKNLHDIETNARDVIATASRDRREDAERDICEVADRDIINSAGRRWTAYVTQNPGCELDGLCGVPNFTQGATWAFTSKFGAASPPCPEWRAVADATSLVQSCEGDVVLAAGTGDATASPDNKGGSIGLFARNGVVLQAWGDSTGTGGCDIADSFERAIHLHHRLNDPIPSAAPTDTPQNPPPIEIGRPVVPQTSTRYLPLQQQAGQRTFLRVLDERAVGSYNRHTHHFMFDIDVGNGGDDGGGGGGGCCTHKSVFDDFDYTRWGNDDERESNPAWDTEPFTDGQYEEGLLGWIENIAGTPNRAGALDQIGAALNRIMEVLQIHFPDEFAWKANPDERFLDFSSRWFGTEVGWDALSSGAPNFSRDFPYGIPGISIAYGSTRHPNKTEPQAQGELFSIPEEVDSEIIEFSTEPDDEFADALPLPFDMALGTREGKHYDDRFPGEPNFDSLVKAITGVGGSLRGRRGISEHLLDASYAGDSDPADIVTVEGDTSPPNAPELWLTENFDSYIGANAESPTVSTYGVPSEGGGFRQVTTEFSRAN